MPSTEQFRWGLAVVAALAGVGLAVVGLYELAKAHPAGNAPAARAAQPMSESAGIGVRADEFGFGMA